MHSWFSRLQNEHVGLSPVHLLFFFLHKESTQLSPIFMIMVSHRHGSQACLLRGSILIKQTVQRPGRLIKLIRVVAISRPGYGDGNGTRKLK